MGPHLLLACRTKMSGFTFGVVKEMVITEASHRAWSSSVHRKFCGAVIIVVDAVKAGEKVSVLWLAVRWQLEDGRRVGIDGGEFASVELGIFYRRLSHELCWMRVVQLLLDAMTRSTSTDAPGAVRQVAKTGACAACGSRKTLEWLEHTRIFWTGLIKSYQCK
ncbi:hypothetical protein AcV5_009655 [Taiwanofungus camphoratus]|nr:hypothetical protein AcV5_009655 [Antrodia cinnamomea]